MILNEKFNPYMKTIRPFFPRNLGQFFFIFKKGHWRPFTASCASVLIWWKHKKLNAKWITITAPHGSLLFFSFAPVIVCLVSLFTWTPLNQYFLYFPCCTVLIYFPFLHRRSLVFNERIWYCVIFFQFFIFQVTDFLHHYLFSFLWDAILTGLL